MLKQTLMFFISTQMIVHAVKAQGRVGIGTSNPNSNYMMHILGQSNTQGLLIESASNSAGAEIVHAGSGPGLRVVKSSGGSGESIRIDHIANQGDALYISKTGTGGSAANFWSSNAANDASTLFSGTVAPNGYGIGAANFANGIGLAIWGGGIRVIQQVLSTGTTISSRGTAYLINGGGPYSFSFTPVNGEIFLFYNNTANPVNIGSVSILPNSGKTCVFMEGALRGF